VIIWFAVTVKNNVDIVLIMFVMSVMIIVKNVAVVQFVLNVNVNVNNL